MTLTLGSLFAGIGGFDLGFERAGFKTLWQCEIDKAAQGVLRRHFPDAKLHSDVCQVGAHNLEPVDVVTYGSPCQDLSVSGKREGLAGQRSGLFHEAVRVIRELRERYGKPDIAIWENVPGAFSSNGGGDFAAVIQTLADIGARDICWRVLDSRYFGVAQRRRRVFLVADFGGERAEQILFESESLRWSLEASSQTRKTSTSRLDERLAYGSPKGISPAVTSKWIKGTGGPSGDECQNLVAHPADRVRRFMPIEVERLQSFPDGWSDGQSDSPRYKQLGNAVTVNVAEWIARRVAATLVDHLLDQSE